VPNFDGTAAIVPGFPRPETEGPHYEAEKAYVSAHGFPRPILVDRAGEVWAGRTLVNIANDLGLEPPRQVVDDGFAASVNELATRDLTVLEWADLVQAVNDQSSTKFVLEDAPKRSAAVSGWFKAHLGKARGFSPSQVEQYLRVARCSPEVRAQLVDVATLHEAIRRLRALEEKPVAPDDSELIEEMEMTTTIASSDGLPTANETAALTTAIAFMEATERVQAWTPSSLEILRGLRDAIEEILAR